MSVLFKQVLAINFIFFFQFNAINQVHAQEKTFKTVTINGKEWTAENLNTSKFNNGDLIKQVRTAKEWNDAFAAKEPVWMYFENNPSNGNKYGRIYNYYAIIDPRGLAPVGFHIPSKNELIELAKVEASQLKSKTDWYAVKNKCKKTETFTNYDNEGVAFTDVRNVYVDGDCQLDGSGNNETGFNAFPSGSIGALGSPIAFKKEVSYWSATAGGSWKLQPNGTAQWYLKISWDEDNASVVNGSSTQGHYVRFVNGKTEQEIEMENQLIRKREDSIRAIKLKEQARLQKRIDSLNQIKKRQEDSINALFEMEQRRLYLIEERRVDSIRAVERKLAERKERRLNRKQHIRLNYWGIGLGIQNIRETQDLLNSNAWKYVSREGLSSEGNPVDGSGFGYSFFIGKRIASIVGIEFMLSEYVDGTYQSTAESTSLYGQSKPSSALLKHTFYSIGPVLTIPFAKSNIDVKYLFSNSRALFREPNGTEVIKNINTTSGTIIGVGLRIPLGGGEEFGNGKISLGQLGFYYDMYKFNYNYSFGTLPAYNTAFTIKYVNTIN